ncbi:response regulator [Amycolatopsis lurida]
MIKVIVADDQQAVREGLAALLGMAGDVLVTGTAANGRQVLDLLTAGTEADVVLMDLRMPVLDGVGATTRITAEHPGVAVVVLTTYADDESIGGALRAGARGYLTKDAGRTEIATALRCAVAGQSAFDPAVTQRLVEALDSTPPASRVPPDRLTAREAEVLGLIGGGLTNAEIAAKLFIGETTVKTHINNAFAKIGVRNRAEAVRYAYRHELS